MLFGLALIFLLGMTLGRVFQKIKLPNLLGMLLIGMVLGPYALNLLDPTLLSISPELRQIALIIILMRAGLSLDITDLVQVGRPAILMCFIPACLEILGMLLLAPKLLGISLLEAAIMGTVVAAVSPAVIVPRMLKLMENGYGTQKSIPQMIMASASVDDVFVIVLFTAFTGLAQGKNLTATSFAAIPISIVLGLLGGVVCGVVLSFLFQRFHSRASGKVLALLSTAFLLVTLEQALKGTLGFSGLLAVMSMGATLQQKQSDLAKHLSIKFSKLWVAAEVLLFVLVGATVDIQYAFQAGGMAIVVILGAVLFRMFGVFLCLLKTNLIQKERIFCLFAYLPKATVQAAIGSLPLSMGLACGNIVLTVAVLSILITAPLGAFAIDRTYEKLLTKK